MSVGKHCQRAVAAHSRENRSTLETSLRRSPRAARPGVCGIDLCAHADTQPLLQYVSLPIRQEEPGLEEKSQNPDVCTCASHIVGMLTHIAGR